MKRYFLTLAAITSSAFYLQSQPLHTGSPLESQGEVLQIVELFFQSMEQRDTTLAANILTSQGRYFGMSPGSDSTWITHTATHQQFIDQFYSRTGQAVERIWDPLVKIHKSIAMVWAPYDIYLDDTFLHCGVDAFSLIKTQEGWKIASVIFTMEPEGCPQNPLGPPTK